MEFNTVRHTVTIYTAGQKMPQRNECTDVSDKVAAIASTWALFVLDYFSLSLFFLFLLFLFPFPLKEGIRILHLLLLLGGSMNYFRVQNTL